MPATADETPKASFLINLDKVIREFEDMTGVEILLIRINRVPIDAHGLITEKTTPFEYDLELR